MRTILPFLALILASNFPGTSLAQDENVKTAKELIEQAKVIQFTDTKGAVDILKRSLLELQSPKDAALNRDTRAFLCVLTAVYDPKAALPIAEQGLVLARTAEDFKAESKMLRCEGYANEQLGNTDLAGQAYEKGVVAAEKSGDKEALAEVLSLRGESRYYNGRYDDAIVDLKRSYDLSVKLGNRGTQRYVLTSMANLYADANVGQYDKAIEYYKQVLKSNEEVGRKSDVATAHFNIGSTLERKEDFDAALQEYLKAYEIDSSLNDASSVAEEERVIGALLTKKNKAAEALPWIERAMAYFQKENDVDGIARVQLTRGITFRKAGRLQDSMNDLEASRKYFETEKNERYLAKIHEERSLTYAADGDWRNAYEAGKTYRAVQQKLDNRLLEEKNSRLRVQFDAERKEQENRILLIENKLRGEALSNAKHVSSLQWQVIILGVALLLLLVILVIRQFYKTRRMRILAMTDELTRLPNRRHILTFLGDQAKLAFEEEQPISVIAFDIDHFKQVNDQHGHDVGDIALKAVANIANQALRRGDRVGRIGGEEFLVVLPGSPKGPAIDVAERLRNSVEVSEIETLPADFRLTISLGVCEWNAGHESIDALLKRADAALYEAKNSGRNQLAEN